MRIKNFGEGIGRSGSYIFQGQEFSAKTASTKKVGPYLGKNV